MKARLLGKRGCEAAATPVIAKASPCARFKIRAVRYASTSPMPRKAYTAPSIRPLMTAWLKRFTGC